ncbi:hypothetical protein A9Q83_14010 [Alphaproteobacteria bacterium 46_93_T64]|nr:hypothetical protein A9Q83_14010 [Alphaproteobacteria bacterium 46_93_T64]
MLNKHLNSYSVMGFATFNKRPGVETSAIIDASLNWSREFLGPLEGIGFHCLFQNMNGGFADIILATDFEALGQMNEDFSSSETSAKMMQLLDPDSIKLNAMAISQEGFTPPEDFSCLEVGFMKSETSSKEQILKHSQMLEENYLRKFDNTKGHFIGEIEPGSYTDVTFGRTLGDTRKICMDFDNDQTAKEFLSLFDPSSFKLDFWSLLA